MKITDVYIRNWQPPGKEWWDDVEAKPDEPLIDARITLTLSWREYKDLMDRQERNNTTATQTPLTASGEGG